MTITVDTEFTVGYSEQLNITAGNERVFKIPEGHRVYFSASGEEALDAPGAGITANIAYTMNYRNGISNLSEFDMAFPEDFAVSCNAKAAPGVCHIALKVSSGSWRFRIRTFPAPTGD